MRLLKSEEDVEALVARLIEVGADNATTGGPMERVLVRWGRNKVVPAAGGEPWAANRRPVADRCAVADGGYEPPRGSASTTNGDRWAHIDEEVAPVAAVESEHHLIEVGWQMFRADLMPPSDDVAL